MSILEVVGFATLFAVGVGAILWAVGVLKIDADVNIKK